MGYGETANYGDLAYKQDAAPSAENVKHYPMMHQLYPVKELLNEDTPTGHSVVNDNLKVIGDIFDDTDDKADELLVDIFPLTTFTLMEKFEKAYNISSEGTNEVRLARIDSAMKARGGLTIEYLEGISNALGSGRYTVVITEGTTNDGFIIHEFGPSSIPAGPATELPGVLTDTIGDVFDLTITVSGVHGGSQPELERLIENNKAAYARAIFVYV